MFVEWWMGLVFLVWWFLSIAQITSSVRKNYYAKGVSAGTNATMEVLVKQGIICISDDGSEITPGDKV